MTAKRTNGSCTCGHDRNDPNPMYRRHLATCPSLCPAQQEPDALTRHLRRCGMSQTHESMALALISEAREEQRRARAAALDSAVTDLLGRSVAAEELGHRHVAEVWRNAASAVRAFRDAGP